MPGAIPSNPAVEQFQSDGFKAQRSPLVSLKADLPRDGANTITFATFPIRISSR